jgi:hypothetical protein
MIPPIDRRARVLRCLTLASCLLGLTASEARIERALEDHHAAVNAATRERDQEVAQVDQRLRQAIEAHRARSVRDLQRLLRHATAVTEQVLIHRALLEVDRDHAPSRAFFTTLGTLEQELAALAPSLPSAPSTAVDILASTAGLPTDEIGRQALWLARLHPADLQQGALRDHSPHARHAQVHGALDFAGSSFAAGCGLQLPEQGLPVGDAWVLAIVGTFPLAGEQPWRTLASFDWGQHHIAVDRNGRPGVFQADWAPADAGDLRRLEGRHCLIAVGAAGRTTFFLDGERIGTSQAQVTQPMIHIGNHLSLDQAWCMPVESIAVFNQALDPPSIAALSARLLQ